MASPKAMKAMKATKAEPKMPNHIIKAIAKASQQDIDTVKKVLEGIVTVAANQLNENGSFKLSGFMNLKLKHIPAEPERYGVGQTLERSGPRSQP